MTLLCANLYVAIDSKLTNYSVISIFCCFIRQSSIGYEGYAHHLTYMSIIAARFAFYDHFALIIEANRSFFSFFLGVSPSDKLSFVEKLLCYNRLLMAHLIYSISFFLSIINEL